ncbi:hypothetical protein [Paraburkholderia ultramafica]|nr:hypothetical protein [Paraburkholderia ultramafica]
MKKQITISALIGALVAAGGMLSRLKFRQRSRLTAVASVSC